MKKIGKALAILLLLSLPAAPESHAAEPMLPQTYSEQTEVKGWLMSEKLDGVRGYWDGQKLSSKNVNPFSPLPEFIHELPPFALEGEIWGGRGTFEQTVSTVRRQLPHAGWRQLKFAIFDVPLASGGFTKRLEKARRWFADHPSDYAFVILQINVRDRDHLLGELARIEAAGGEGLIVRSLEALYQVSRAERGNSQGQELS